MGSRRRLAVLAASAVAGVAIAGGAAAAGTAGNVGFVLSSLAAGTAFAVVGALLLGLRRGNRLGPVLFIAGAALVGEGALRGYAVRGLVLDPGSLPLAEVAGWAGFVLDPLFFPVPLALVLLLFPDGLLPSRRWRPVAALAVAVVVAQVALLALRTGPLPDETHGYALPWRGVLPAGSAEAVGSALDLLTLAGLVLLAAAAGSLVLRYRRCDPDGRQRLRPLALAGALAVGSLLGQQVPGLEQVGTLGFVAAVALGFPLALAVGALRYRVWELDRVLVATLVYGVLTAAVTAVYVGVVLAFAASTGSSAPAVLPSVLATALVAVAFAPVKERLSRVAGRLVLGPRADPYRALAALPHRLADAPAAGEVLPRTADALVNGLGVPAARVRAFLLGSPNGSDEPAAEVAWAPGPPREDRTLVRVPVQHLGQLVGDVAVVVSPDRPLSTADRRLLADLAAQAGPALRGVALAAELQLRLDQITEQAQQLRASRQRIATAQVAERRRLERDIHDGAQQQLIALAVHLRAALGATDPAAGAAAVQRCLDELGGCIDDLRELARGIYPPVLASRGLAAALRARARVTPGDVRVVTGPGADRARWDGEVEVAAYFTCLEALQNAAKHAPTAAVVVALDVRDGGPAFSVTDDGAGFDPTAPHGGTGLLGMADRIGALGGTLAVVSRPGAGTSVRGYLPVSTTGSAVAPREPGTTDR